MDVSDSTSMTVKVKTHWSLLMIWQPLCVWEPLGTREQPEKEAVGEQSRAFQSIVDPVPNPNPYVTRLSTKMRGTTRVLHLFHQERVERVSKLSSMTGELGRRQAQPVGPSGQGRKWDSLLPWCVGPQG